VTRVLLLSGVVGPLLFIVTFLVDGATRPGYDPWRNFVSSLATGDRGWIQVTNFIVWSVLALALSIGLLRRRVLGPGLLIALYGASVAVAGIFVTDPSLGYPPGALPEHTTHGQLHSVAALAAFLLNAVAAAATAAHFVSDPRWLAFVRYSVLTGLAVLALFLASAVLPVLDARGVWPNAPAGLVQRISIIVGLAWFSAFAFRLWREEGRPHLNAD
jgi:hypothetical membrane protein